VDDARRQAAEEAELAARSSYGRLLSIITAQTRDISAAEDALAEAFAAAMTQWPRDGVPANPLGWLVTVARRGLYRQRTRLRQAGQAADIMKQLEEERQARAQQPWGDERLSLLFACTHPGIDRDIQAPLMLQSVLGLDAARIAASFLVPAATMGQRLVRAKRKIRDAGIAFGVPEPAEARQRLDAVLSAIYAAYGTAWDDVAGADARLAGLAAEAIFLVRLMAQLLPDAPEVLGLLALLLYCQSRTAARRTPDGRFVPLYAQDTGLWSRPMLAEAEAALRKASAKNEPGRYQTEAAIQSLHVHQLLDGKRYSGPMVRLYDTLAHFAPTTGVMVARAVAYAEQGDTAAGLGQLAGMGDQSSYQPWWAARARISWLAGDEVAAHTAATRAAGLTSDPAIRRFLLEGGYKAQYFKR
jgi:RNA polymerase sigma-70 factor (ECF subfamily)